MNIEIWQKLNKEIKEVIFKNGLTPEKIKKPVYGELNELAIKTSHGIETLFYGNGEAFITVDVNGTDYEFTYVVDTYGEKNILTDF